VTFRNSSTFPWFSIIASSNPAFNADTYSIMGIACDHISGSSGSSEAAAE